MTSGNKRVVIHTDGACSGNPGPGGWGAILECDGREKELFGGAPLTTNNRMEMTAAIEALSAITTTCRSSSTPIPNICGTHYEVDRAGSATAEDQDREPVKNADLWQRSTRSAQSTRWTGAGCAAMPATM